MIPSNLVLDVKRARPFACVAGVAGAYGAPQKVALEPGLYLAMVDGPGFAAIRFTQDGSFRVDGTGNKMEVPIQPLLPLHLLIPGPAAVAARTTAVVVWFVPLLAVDSETGELVRVKCKDV